MEEAWDHPFGLDVPSVLGASPFPGKTYLDSFTSIDEDMVGHQETD